MVPYLHTKPTTLERDPRFHRLLPRLQTAASAHHNQAPKWTPKRALTFSRSTKCTYARHGWPRTALSPALGVLAAPRLLNSTQSAADRASPSSSLSGTTGSTAAFTNNATKAELDEAPRSARWSTPFIIRDDTTSPRGASRDTRVYGSIASEATTVSGDGLHLAQRVLERYYGDTQSRSHLSSIGASPPTTPHLPLRSHPRINMPITDSKIPFNTKRNHIIAIYRSSTFLFP